MPLTPTLLRWSAVGAAVAGLIILSAPVHSESGVVHAVDGRGWSGGTWGEFEFHVAVHEKDDGSVWGWNRFYFFHGATGFELSNAARIECLEVDPETSEAWISGVITKSNRPDIFPVGSPVLAYFKDGGPGEVDLHGAGRLPSGMTCHDRPAPNNPRNVQHGNYVVR